MNKNSFFKRKSKIHRFLFENSWQVLSYKLRFTVFVKICYFNYKVKINSKSEKIIDFDEKSGKSEKLGRANTAEVISATY